MHLYGMYGASTHSIGGSSAGGKANVQTQCVLPYVYIYIYMNMHYIRITCSFASAAATLRSVQLHILGGKWLCSACLIEASSISPPSGATELYMH